MKIDGTNGQAEEISKQEFITADEIKAGACPLFTLMPDGTIVAYHYQAPKMEVGKKIDQSCDKGIVQTFDIRTGLPLLKLNQGITSGLSECIHIDFWLDVESMIKKSHVNITGIRTFKRNLLESVETLPKWNLDDIF